MKFKWKYLRQKKVILNLQNYQHFDIQSLVVLIRFCILKPQNLIDEA